MRWFRFYSDVLDDPKVQRLPDHLFKVWVNLLCLANEGDPRGSLPSLDDIAFRLRMSQEQTETLIRELRKAGLLDMGDDGLEPHNWEGRQRASDGDPTNAERQRRYRQQHNAPPEEDRNALRNDDDNGTVTRLDKTRVDTEEIQTREEQKPTALARARDELFESVVDVCYQKPHTAITKTERGRVNDVLPELRDVNATPELVRSRYAEWQCRALAGSFTPQTLAKMWTDLGVHRPARASPDPYHNSKGGLTPLGIRELDLTPNGSVIDVKGQVRDRR